MKSRKIAIMIEAESENSLNDLRKVGYVIFCHPSGQSEKSKSRREWK
jgi:hypothetical protein